MQYLSILSVSWRIKGGINSPLHLTQTYGCVLCGVYVSERAYLAIDAIYLSSFGTQKLMLDVVDC